MTNSINKHLRLKSPYTHKNFTFNNHCIRQNKTDSKIYIIFDSNLSIFFLHRNLLLINFEMLIRSNPLFLNFCSIII